MPEGPKGYQEYLESYNSHVGGQQRQTISVTDLISEGPIQGLVDGQASIYLNDDRAAPLSQAATSASQSKASISLTNNSATATISDGSIVLADNGKKYLIVKKGYGSINVTATNPRVSSIDAATHCTLTAGSSFFTDAMVSSISSILSYVPCTLVTTSDSDGESNEGHGQGFISRRTSTTVATFAVGGGGGGGTWKPSGTYSLEVDRVIEISSISGSTVTLASAWAGTTGSYKYDVTGTIVDTVDTVTQTQIANYEALTTQFRVGTKSQEPFIDIGGHGSTSISNSPSAGGTIEQTSGYGDGTQAAKVLVGSSSAGFNLSASQLQEVDEARFTWAYGSGHYAVSGKGNNQPTYTQYSITFQVKKPGETSFENTDILNREVLHSGMYVNAVTFVQKIDLQQYRPFIDFKLTIKRMSNHTGPGYKSKGQTFHDWQNISAASITNTTCVIKDKLSHPYCAMAKVGFTSQQFQGMPKRGYHARGLKVQVPSNYVTREENAGVSTYTRNVSTGVVTSTYQDWDGAFRRFAVYTNNPAWVFYDILTNNRYGLGDFLQEEHIDKYMLYRIARYCDELVDDGKGGTEPRFTCNLYFQKQADAYKVVKDIATVFRSMVYYFDGQVSPIIDAPSGPVYNFTKANVIDGSFSYEGTGSKTRINQCIVSWIDPDANYKPSPLLVEDRRNIAETGKIISQDSVAMGAITEGQALRYGRWKLWTAANQREVVSFKSSLNSSFIVPGDIINVQDADRYATRYGGRISNSGTTRSVSSIPLDSSVTLAVGSTYTLSVIFDQPGAFATETVTINGTIYDKGDLIKRAYIDSNGNGTYTLQDIDTEEKAVNAKATTGGTDALILNWADTHRVETETVTTSAGATETITVQSAFSEVPNAEAIWVLTETTSGDSEVKGSAKQYKVLAISQGENSEYAFTAVEHYDEKFAAVDEDFTTFIADTVYPAVRSLDFVPPVKDVRSRNTPEFAGRGGALRISWTPPTNVGEVLGRYEHLSGYEIIHNFDKVTSPIKIMNPNTTSILLRHLTVGTYSVAVRVINTLNNVSEPVIVKVHVSNNHKDRDIPRLVDDVPVGGTTTVGYTVDGNTFKVKRSGYGAKHPGSDSSWVNNTNTTATAWQQDCSNLPNITWSESDRNSEGEFIVEHAYILMDFSDATDRFKLLKYYKPTGSGTAHWYDTGTGNTTNRFGSALTGTFTKATESSKVTGSGTAFTTQIEQGDILKLGSEEIRVAAVESNTVLYLEVATDTVHSSVSGFIPNIRIDYSNDVIVARVYKTSSGLVLAETYSQIDAMLKPAGDYIEAGGVTNDEMGPDSVGNDEIADNAVGEDQINVSSVSAISANLGSITAGTMRSNVTDYIPDANAAPSGDENGAFIDLTAGKFVFGDANEYILWDGNNVTISGATISGASISGGSADVNATITVKEDGTTRLSSAGILNCTTALDVSASGAQATISHSNISRSDATSSASPSAGSTFTAVDSVTTNSQGHVTGINVKTVTMPAGVAANDATITFSAGTYLGGGGAITVNQSSNETITFNHDNTTRSDTTSSASPAHGSTFTAVDSVTTNTQGHITAANVKTITLPAEATVNNATLTISAGTALGGGGNFTANQSSNETLTINHDNISRSNTTSSAAPGYGSTFTAIGGVSSNSQGHITGVETKTITIPASDNTNTFRTIKVDTSGNGSANNTLTSTEDLMLKKGTNVTLAESNGVVTISSSNDNTTYDLSVAQNTDNTNNNPRLRLEGTNSTNDYITIIGGDKIDATRDTNSQLTIDHAPRVGDANTTSPAGYSNADSLSVSGKVKLLAGVTHDTFGHIEGSNGLILDFNGPVVADIPNGEVDIIASTLTATNINSQFANFGSMAADVASITNLTTDFLDADQIISKDIRVGISAEVTVANFVVGRTYKVVNTGNLSQAQWNTVGGTTDKVYGPGKIFTAANVSFPTDANAKADDYNNVALIGDTVSASTISVGDVISIVDEGNTPWYSVGGTSSSTSANDHRDYEVGDIVKVVSTSSVSGTTGTVKILTGEGTHLNDDGEILVGKTATENFIYFSEAAGKLIMNVDDFNGVRLKKGWNQAIAVGSTATPKNSSVLIGYHANASGYATTAIGGSSGLYIGSTSNSVVTLNGDGGDNTVVGYQAGRDITTGKQNVFIGATAGKTNVSSNLSTGWAAKTGYGNIGIGANNYRGHQVATGKGVLADLTSGDRNISIGYRAGSDITTGSGNVIIGGYAGDATADNRVTIATGAGVRRMYFDSNGNATISGNLTTTGNIDLPRAEFITFYGDGAEHHAICSRDSVGATADDIRINSYGAVYVNLDSNNNNNSGADFLIGRHGSSAGSMSTLLTVSGETGDLTATGNVTAYSDERLKENVQTLDGKKILEMRGVSFTKDGKEGSGVIAQELEKIAPELVHDGEYKSVAYGNLTGYLIEAIKEQQSEIDELKDLVKQLLKK